MPSTDDHTNDLYEGEKDIIPDHTQVNDVIKNRHERHERHKRHERHGYRWKMAKILQSGQRQQR